MSKKQLSDTSQTYYPPVSFFFKVTFGLSDTIREDSQFQSVTGLTVTVEQEEFQEGGELRFKHKLPKGLQFGQLQLTRGLLLSSKVAEWIRDAVENFEFSTCDITIQLLNEKQETLMAWEVIGAYPIEWSISGFNAEENKIMIESMKMQYQYFRMSSQQTLTDYKRN